MPKKKYNIIGLMSGTSLDGLDIAYCAFNFKRGVWTYKIEKAQTISYNANWKNKLGNAHKVNAEKLCALDAEFGSFIGKQVLAFCRKNKIKHIDLISSHGHTVFHQPEKGFTLQIGSGAAIAAISGIKTICDFRSGDVALGGQGAPLVPIGDQLLFSEYQACLNLGGIANISFKVNRKRIAFDICPANMVLNCLSLVKGLPYDKGGKLAAKGEVHWNLFKKLNSIPYYKDYKSKSLGRESIEKDFITRINQEQITNNDRLATAAEHTAFQIARVLNHFKLKNVLLTGGGVYNTDLISRITAYSNCKLIIPDDNTIKFKEALIFAFLGVLRERGEVNCLKAVTGANRDSCGGAVYSDNN